MNALRLAAGCISIALIFFNSAYSQESALQNRPITGNALELRLPSSDAFEPEKPHDEGQWSLKEAIKDSPAFFRDLTAKINLRTYYFNDADAADAPNNDKEKVSWAGGGSTQIRSGKLYDVFNVHAEIFTSQHIYGPDDKDGARLLEPGQQSFWTLGVANTRFEYEGNLVALYRHRLDMPYVNSQDNRMVPNTFENYVYSFIGKGDNPPLRFAVGYLDAMKKRDSDEFISMSEAAGVVGSERGMPWVGARIRPDDEINIVAVNYSGIDFLNIFYSDVEYAHKLNEDWSIKSSLQFSAQNSIGDDLLIGESTSTVMWGFQQALSFRKAMIRTALTVNDKSTSIRSPFGTYPGYNCSIVEDFNRAGEIAWKLGLSYDFSGVGLKGLTMYSDYISGNRAVDETGLPLRDKSETDINIDYRISEGSLKSFWLRLRAGFVHEDTVGTTEDLRVILNYEVPIT